MQSISTIGLDIAKSVFQVHGIDADGLVVIRRLCVPKTQTRT
jgi:transposase